MLKTRLIAVLVCRDGRIVQSVKFKHTNVIHADAIHAMEAFNKWAVDEIIIINVSRGEESKEQFREVVESVSKHCFVPLSAGGWINDEEYAQALLRSGADKLVLNTALEDDPDLVKKLSLIYGRQCIVASMDVKLDEEKNTKVVVDRGRRFLDQNAADWAKHAVALGAGEIMFNSVDHDGARRGYNLDVLSSVCDAVNIPVIAFGGVFTWQHLVTGIEAGASAVAVANQFHYTEQATRKAKSYMAEAGIVVRQEGQKLF